MKRSSHQAAEFRYFYLYCCFVFAVYSCACSEFVEIHQIVLHKLCAWIECCFRINVAAHQVSNSLMLNMKRAKWIRRTEKKNKDANTKKVAYFCGYKSANGLHSKWVTVKCRWVKHKRLSHSCLPFHHILSNESRTSLERMYGALLWSTRLNVCCALFHKRKGYE